jgi:hypothetical protein
VTIARDFHLRAMRDGEWRPKRCGTGICNPHTRLRQGKRLRPGNAASGGFTAASLQGAQHDHQLGAGRLDRGAKVEK